MKNKSIAKNFAILAILFGSLLTFFIPPFQSADEDSHFKKAYVISRGDFFPTVKDGVEGFYLPNQMVSYISEKLEYIGNLDQKYSYKELLYEERDHIDYANSSFYNFSTVSTIPLAHLVPAIGMDVGKAVGYLFGMREFSTTYLLYFGRMASLIFYVVVIAFAIKLTPKLKRTFAMIGLLPMSLSLGATISYDAILISLSLLVTALILRLICLENEKFDMRYMAVFVIIGVIFLNLKTVYSFVMLPLSYLMFKNKEDFKENFKKICIMAVLIVIGTVILKLPTIGLDVAKSADNSSSMQINFILNNPIYFIKVLFKEIFGNRLYYLSGLFGLLGLIDTYLLVPVYFATLMVFLIVGFIEVNSDEIYLPVLYKSLNIVCFIIGVIGVFTAFYILWTVMIPGYGIGANAISGVQGRYFIPLLPLIFMIFNVKNKKIRHFCTNSGVKIIDYSLLFSTLLLVITFIIVMLRFWI